MANKPLQTSRSLRLRALVFGAFALPLLVSAAPLPNLAIGLDGLVNARSGTQPLRWLMLADGASAPILNRAAAQRLGFKPGWFGATVKVGPVRVPGSTAVMRFSIGAFEFKRRMGWFERDIAPAYDGMLGPGAVPFPVISFKLRAPQPCEQVMTLPLVDSGLQGMGTSYGKPAIMVQFDPQRARSIATAAAGADLARLLDGELFGAVRQEHARFGVMRPVRELRFARPFMVAVLRLNAMLVRTSDYGNTGAIRDADADPSEIVVTAKSKVKAIRVIHLGADALQHCSSLVFDKPRRQLRLSCLPQ